MLQNMKEALASVILRADDILITHQMLFIAWILLYFFSSRTICYSLADYSGVILFADLLLEDLHVPFL